ncbi:uncharacterized protein GIQ15_03705 [Arthroderma uncinatum]|uniref:uncharacterized protein n=1 Tax=Arthroderma uncinatum TaxID=74035 RepID=UPI00144A7D95|nr:uncharacterized protein GIQ15_03705 [Arthroderma uncinatum]KAF3484381.1 hypothetical protein GIQ15_03705 [Arthroderma uncinatum]
MMPRAHSVSSDDSESGIDTPGPRVEKTPAPTGDDGAAAIAELEAAIAANPDLRPVTPQPAEWEDYDTILAQNPEIANPVPGRKKEFYMSKDRWECGHEGDPVVTTIEHDASQGDAPAILINDVRGICEKCMDKWRKLESSGHQSAVAASSSSSGPAHGPGLPSYEQAWEGSDTAAASARQTPLPLLDLDDDYDSSSEESDDSLGPPPGSPPNLRASVHGNLGARSRP